MQDVLVAVDHSDQHLGAAEIDADRFDGCHKQGVSRVPAIRRSILSLPSRRR
jgi:hypothetical protein